MHRYLYRTHTTSLSDDELTLFDVLSDFDITSTCLRRDRFAERFNHRPHNLDDERLADTLARFDRQDLLQAEPLGEGTSYGLTARGGEVWEAERTPVWSRYGTHGTAITASGRVMVSFCGVTRASCEDFVRVGPPWTLRPYCVTRVKFARIAKPRLTPWKSFPSVHVAVLMTDSRDGECIPAEEYVRFDLREYDRRRTWWGSVFELQKFVGPGAVGLV